MSKVVNMGETQTLQVSNKTVRGVRVVMYLVATAVNVTLDGGDYNWKSTTIKATLMRKKQNYTLVSTTLDVMQQAATFESGEFQSSYSTIDLSAIYTPPILRAAGVATKEIISIPIEFHFTSDVELFGDDILQIECNAAQGCFTGSADSSASYFLMAEIEGSQFEEGIPAFKVLAIQPAQQSLQFFAGNMVNELFFFNTDKYTILSAMNVISNLTLNSDGKQENLQYIELLSKRNIETAHDDHSILGQTFRLLRKDNSMKVSVNLQFTTVNVNTGCNFIGYHCFEEIELANKINSLRAMLAGASAANSGNISKQLDQLITYRHFG